MLITRKSMFTNKFNTLEVPVTPEQLAWYYQNKQDVMIQEAFPNLSAPLREFILTGVTPDEWVSVFGLPDPTEEDEDDNINFVGPADQIEYF